MNTQDSPKVGDRVTSEYIKNAAIQRAVVTEEHAAWYKVFVLLENGKSFDAIFKWSELRKLGSAQKNLAFRVCKIAPDGSKDCNWASAFRPGLLKASEFIEVSEDGGDFIPIEEWDNQKGGK